MPCAENCPRRYLVVCFGFFGLLISIGYRTVFALVMTHTLKHSGNSTDEESFFPRCTTPNTTRDYKVSWSGEDVSFLHTGYFVGSWLTQLPGGMLATRVSPKRVCGFLIMASSVLFLLLPVSVKFNYDLVMIIRVLQGLVEGGSVPALNGVISAWAPRYEKSRMVTLVYAGAYLSPAIALISTGATTCYASWDAILYIYGGCGIIWAILWLLIVTDTPALNLNLGIDEREIFENERQMKRASSKTMQNVPWKSILTSIPVYAVFVGAFCRNWIFSLLLVEQPQYFKDAFHMNSAEIGILSALPHILMTIVVICGGQVFDQLIKRGTITTTVGRKLAQCIGFGVEASCVLGLHFVDKDSWHTALILLCCGVAVSGLAISGYQVNPLDLAPQYVSILTGIARLGSLGAILSTTVAGTITGINHTIGEWQEVFLIAAVIHYAGVLFYGIFASGCIQSWAGIEEEEEVEPDEITPILQSEQLPPIMENATGPRPSATRYRGSTTSVRRSTQKRLSSLEDSVPIY